MYHITLVELKSRCTELFGSDEKKWEFICPSCGHVQSGDDFTAIGKDQNLALSFCIGRFTEPKHVAFGGKAPCNYQVGNGRHEMEIEGAPAFKINDPNWL